MNLSILYLFLRTNDFVKWICVLFKQTNDFSNKQLVSLEIFHLSSSHHHYQNWWGFQFDLWLTPCWRLEFLSILITLSSTWSVVTTLLKVQKMVSIFAGSVVNTLLKAQKMMRILAFSVVTTLLKARIFIYHHQNLVQNLSQTGKILLKFAKNHPSSGFLSNNK